MKLVNRKVKFCTVIERVVFTPGLNQLSDSDFAKVANNGSFKSELDCGNMEIAGTVETETTNAVEMRKVKDHSAKIAQEILSLKVPEAEIQIAKMDNLVVLNAIKKLDGRTGIHDAVNKRIEFIDSQRADDLKKVSKEAPNGTGDDLVGSQTGKTQDEIDGKKATTAIPALQDKK